MYCSAVVTMKRKTPSDYEDTDDESFDTLIVKKCNKRMVKEPLDSSVIVLEDSIPEVSPPTNNLCEPSLTTEEQRCPSPVASSSVNASRRRISEDTPDFQTVFTSTPQQYLQIEHVYNKLNAEVDNEQHQLQKDCKDLYSGLRNSINHQVGKFAKVMGFRRAALSAKMEEVRGHQQRLTEILRRLEAEVEWVDVTMEKYIRFEDGFPEELEMFSGKIMSCH